MENNRVNDGFFPLFSLFSDENRAHHFSLLHQPKYIYHAPSPSFLERERGTRPRLLLEIRKGLHFPDNASLSVQVSLSSSNANYISPSSGPTNPRWYYLVLHYYQRPKESEKQAIIRVMDGNKAVAVTNIDLTLMANRYGVFWLSLALEGMQKAEKPPKMEFRVFNLTDPEAFWSTESEEFKAAVTAIASTTRFS